MNVLSLFDGMSCGQIALRKLGFEIDNYYASEIDKHAIKVTMENFPKTIQLGDILNLNSDTLPKIDLLIGGSPCQSFSSAGKGEGFDGKSGLFWEYVRVLREVNPKYFLLENVQMKKEWEDVITEALGVKPIFINSRLVSAQDRKRLYWTNIPGVNIPEDRNVKFSDISEDKFFCGAMRGRRINPITNTRDDYNKEIKLEQYIECRADDKTNCLTTVQKDNVAVEFKLPRQPIKNISYRWLSPLEYERLQTVPDGYTSIASDNQRKRMLGNGWTVDVIAHILKNIKK